MVEIGLLIGIFSYIVFGLGLLGKLGMLGRLGKLGGVGIFLVLIFLIWKNKSKFFKELRILKKDKINIFLIGILLISVLVNFVGALGPELGFDALWYHLTIPKIYLQNNGIYFIPGGLFYYSAVPKLTEMFYLTSLVFFPLGNLAKIIHFSFGILSAVVLYSLSKRYLDIKWLLLTVLIFYTTLIVGWESTTAYIDLARTFFEILALKLFLEWDEEKDRTNQTNKIYGVNMKFIESAIMLGLSISTKLIAFISLPIFLLLIYIKGKKIKDCLVYLLVCLFIVSPWLVFSFVNTGNPIYPIFSGILDKSHQLTSFNFIKAIKDIWGLFYNSQDLLSPIFLIFIPIVVLNIYKGKLKRDPCIKIIGEYIGLSLVGWYFTPRTGGGRFILPYLPTISLFFVLIITNSNVFMRKSLMSLAILAAMINISYRMLANLKYAKVVFGKQTTQEFLRNNLDFQNGDFFDEGGKIKKIVKNDSVLIFGSHNLFYADFNFVHESYAKKGDFFAYALTQNVSIPEKYGKLEQIYQNPLTRVNLYLFGKEFK